MRNATPVSALVAALSERSKRASLVPASPSSTLTSAITRSGTTTGGSVGPPPVSPSGSPFSTRLVGSAVSGPPW